MSACVLVHVWGRKHESPQLRVWAKMKTPPSSSNSTSVRGWGTRQILYPKSQSSVILLIHTYLWAGTWLDNAHFNKKWTCGACLMSFNHPQAQRLSGVSLPAALWHQQERRTISKLAHMSPKPTLGWDESSPGDATRLPSDYRGPCTTLLEQSSLTLGCLWTGWIPFAS